MIRALKERFKQFCIIVFIVLVIAAMAGTLTPTALTLHQILASVWHGGWMLLTGHSNPSFPTVKIKGG